MLPDIPNKSGASRFTLDAFGGLERRGGAAFGAISAMTNLTGRSAPLLASRPGRRTVAAQTNPRGMCAVGSRLFTVDGNRLYRDGAAFTGTLPGAADAERSFAALGTRLLLWPDRICVDAEGSGTTEALAASVTRSCTFADGTYAGEAAEANTILGPSGTDWGALFRAGDAVTISGAADAENNRTAIVREIDGRALRFYEHTFTPNAAARQITVARTVPELDFLCVCGNRVWGCRGDTIRCCALGDPFNWNVFDGLSTDAWSAETGTPGAFTGCVSFMGWPVFFKADRIFKVYGSRPGNFEVISSATLGVLPGAAKTLAVAGETLYYLSRAGFVRYNGGYPTRVDAALDTRYAGGAAGSDGRRMFVSALRGDGARELLAYDPETGMWHREDALAVRDFACADGTLYAQTASAVLAVGDAPDPNEPAAASSVTFAPFDAASFASKYPVRLWLRYESAGPLTAEIAYDGGAWETAAALPAGGRADRNTPVPIRRCGRFALRLSAAGAWKLYALQVETRAERTNRK